MGVAREGALRWLRFRHSRIARYLERVDPRAIIRAGERKALKVFRRAARSVPAYRRLLRDRGVDPGSISTIEDFRKQVPLMDKEALFGDSAISCAAMGGNLREAFLFYSSSGYSGCFSYGVETLSGLQDRALEVELILDLYFGALRKRTLLINSLPMSVRIPMRHIPQAETGVRWDAAIALIDRLRNDFDQFILVAEPLLVKRIVEEGAERGLEWEKLVVHIVTGAEYVAENFRSYVASILAHDIDRPELGSLLINMGLSEVSSSIMREDHGTVRIRRAAFSDPRLRAALCGSGWAACPIVATYLPSQVYLEVIDPDENGFGEMVVTLLDDSCVIPIIRYRTGDKCKLLSSEQLRNVLDEYGYGSLAPRFGLPVCLFWGRDPSLELATGKSLSSNLVKEALYHDPLLASSHTGRFVLGRTDRGPELLVELRAGHAPTPQLHERLRAALGAFLPVPLDPTFVTFGEITSQPCVDYERKNRYVVGELQGRRHSCRGCEERGGV